MKNLYKSIAFIVFLDILLSINVVAEQVGEDTGLSIGEDTGLPMMDCVLEPSEIIDIGSAVAGVLEAVNVDRSDFVDKGTVLAQLESDVEDSTVKLTRARADINTAIEVRQINADFGERTEKRNQALVRNSTISEQMMDQVETDAQIAKSQVKQEQENKFIAELEYRRAQASLHRRTMMSPITGVVIERFKSVGEYVEDEPVLRIAQLDPLHVEVIVPMSHWGQIESGMQAEVQLEIPGQDKHNATVIKVDQVADAASGTFGVQLVIPNPDYKIPSSVRCNLAFISTEKDVDADVDAIGQFEKTEYSLSLKMDDLSMPSETGETSLIKVEHMEFIQSGSLTTVAND
jgi:RND family efflux transporter MFP subunit